MMVKLLRDNYQIICTLRIGNLNFLTILLNDFQNGCLIAVKLFSSNDKINWEWDTSSYPNDLIAYLKSQSNLITSGYYDLRTWEMTIWEQETEPKFKELTKLNGEILKEGIKKLRTILEKQLENTTVKEKKLNLASFPSFEEYRLKILQNKFIIDMTTSTELIFRLYTDSFIKILPGTVFALNLYTKHLNILDADGIIHSIKYKEIIGLDNIH